MRIWTKYACVVLALGVPLILLVVGLYGSVRQTQANTRIASRTHATLTAAVRPAAMVVMANNPATYVVQRGDTLSGIAARYAVPGGWSALYAANQALLGPNPNVIQPGTVLVLPGKAATVSYTVRSGDTLSGIAVALAVPGGWQALYAANHQAIGTNPSVIQPGTVLMVPRRVASATTPGKSPRPVQRPMTSSGPSVPHPAQPPRSTGTRHAHVLVRTKRPAATGMPWWLVTMLQGVALLIGAAFLAEPVLVLAGRRRNAARPHQITVGGALQRLGHARRAAVKPRIVIADYDRLVVIQCKNDDTVYVLRPPGEDPAAVLRAARLVLREHSYQQLADHLGAPTSTQTGDSQGSKPGRQSVLPDGSGGLGLQGPPQFFGLRNPSEDWDQDLLRRDSTKAAT
jgi:LysM repeat protein